MNLREIAEGQERSFEAGRKSRCWRPARGVNYFIETHRDPYGDGVALMR